MAVIKESTKNIISFLRQPASFPHHPPKVEIRQTHASVLALAPPYVYKVKKQVNLGFLDFTTLEKRKKNCERERQLNSRFCPDLYLEVVPIASKHNQLFFGSEGQIVDYALKMGQLPEGYFLNQLLQANQVNHDILEVILVTLKTFYEKFTPNPDVAAFGQFHHIKATTEENINTLQQFTDGPKVVHPDFLEAIQEYFGQFLAENQPLFRKRVLEHKIRDCHGDLHLDHIHIRQNQVCIFDCIEFNDQFRYIDVASDIAFLAMDFDFQGYPDMAAYVTTRMSQLLNDPDMYRLIDFYKCYRACVRAKVECLKLREPEVPASERESSRLIAKQYVSLALNYSLFGSGPAILLVCGRSGTGKSTLAKKIAKLFNWKYISSDVTRKVAFGLPLYHHANGTLKPGLYSKPVTDQLYQNLLKETLTQVKNYRSIVVDATFGQEKHRKLFVEALAQLKVPFYFLEMEAADEVIKKRLAQRDKCRHEVSDARLADFDLLRHIYQEPKELLPEHLVKVNAEHAKEAVVNEVIKKLSRIKLEPNRG